MKCIACVIDEDGYVIDVKDSDKFDENDFEPIGELKNKDEEKIFYFSIIEEEIDDDNMGPWNAYVLLEDDEYEEYSSNDFEVFSGYMYYFTM